MEVIKLWPLPPDRGNSCQFSIDQLWGSSFVNDDLKRWLYAILRRYERKHSKTYPLGKTNSQWSLKSSSIKWLLSNSQYSNSVHEFIQFDSKAKTSFLWYPMTRFFRNHIEVLMLLNGGEWGGHDSSVSLLKPLLRTFIGLKSLKQIIMLSCPKSFGHCSGSRGQKRSFFFCKPNSLGSLVSLKSHLSLTL